MKNKNLLIGLGVAIVAYYLWKKNKDKTVVNSVATLTEQEKTSLFEKAINSWKYGVAPPPEWEENNRKAVDLAKAQIKEFKLETEFSAWLANRPKVDYGNQPPPMSAPQVADRPCKKWIQPQCITTPCPPECAEY
jgi:hypothetical protein